MTRRLVGPTFALAVGWLLACESNARQEQQTLADTTPAPEPGKECLTGRAPTDTTALQACLKGLTFDTATAASDEQPLTVIAKPPGPPCPGDPRHTRSCTYGPIARIEPVIEAYRYTPADLRQGRVIARIFLRRGETKSYPKFGLEPGLITYWWVKTDTDTDGSSYYLTQVPGKGLRTAKHPMHVYQHAKVTRTIARWIWDLNDEKSQGGCTATSSCK